MSEKKLLMEARLSHSLLAGRGGEEPLRTGEPLGSVPRGRLPRKICPVTSGRQRDSRSSRRHAPGGPKIARLLPLVALCRAWYRGSATWPPRPVSCSGKWCDDSKRGESQHSCCSLGTWLGAGKPSSVGQSLAGREAMSGFQAGGWGFPLYVYF